MILIFDSHPVQYKAPVYRVLNCLFPESFLVVYYTDCSVRGYKDPGFNREVQWDQPLMSGYSSTVLNNVRGTALGGFWSLHGGGIWQLLRDRQPTAVIISQFLYVADFCVLIACFFLRIPVWIRHETQDEANRRPRWKSFIRSIFYRLVYKAVSKAFYIGALNRCHLLRHGFANNQLVRSPYCVDSPIVSMGEEEKIRRREVCRRKIEAAHDDVVVLFSGKLIPKKDPALLLECIQYLSDEEKRRLRIVFMGSGTLEADLRERASGVEVPVVFTGFVNQSEISDFYLAADVLVLPSRRMGETWGLVVNEALHAGCGVIMTDAVGCSAEFGAWARVRVIHEGDASGLAASLVEMLKYPRSFSWCAPEMREYTVEAAARGIGEGLHLTIRDQLPDSGCSPA